MADEQKSPIEQALDLFLYGPVGLALTAKDEFPKLIDKGRQRLGAQLTMAKFIGQFAVTQGQKEAEKAANNAVGRLTEIAERLNTLGGSEGQTTAARRAAPPASAPPAGASGVATSPPVEDDVLYPPTTGNGANGAARAAHAPSANGSAAVASPDADSLAIPGYDSLSASQVVQRLAGLSAAELDEVGRYEEAHRGRRTILSKVSQLQADRA